MTAQRAFESCGRQAEQLARAERRVVARQHLGVCESCHVPLAQHFNRRNQFLSCDDAVRRYLERVTFGEAR
jgi:hypothetical protein